MSGFTILFLGQSCIHPPTPGGFCNCSQTGGICKAVKRPERLFDFTAFAGGGAGREGRTHAEIPFSLQEAGAADLENFARIYTEHFHGVQAGINAAAAGFKAKGADKFFWIFIAELAKFGIGFALVVRRGFFRIGAEFTLILIFWAHV
jgi:hypothetical protein